MAYCEMAGDENQTCQPDFRSQECRAASELQQPGKDKGPNRGTHDADWPGAIKYSDLFGADSVAARDQLLPSDAQLSDLKRPGG
jgi:hypothetical protein